MTELKLFCKYDACYFPGKLMENEIVYCIGGLRNDIFVGTDQGRLLRFRILDGKFKLVEGRQFPSKKAVTSIDLASALNSLFIVCGFEFHIVTLDDFKITPVLSDVTRFAVNCNPTIDDPFAVQTAFAMGKKGLFLIDVTERGIKKRFQYDTAMPVRNLAFSKNTVCYALEHHYLALNIITRQAIRLFQHDCPTPCIAVTGPDEYIVRSSSGLSIFVNGDGTSSKPPCLLSTTKGPLFYKDPYIIHCDRNKLAMQDCYSQHTEDFPFERIDAINYIEGQIFVLSNGTGLHIVKEAPPEITVATLMENRDYAQAIILLQKSLNAHHDEALVDKLTECCDRNAIVEISKDNFEAATKSLLTCTMNVKEILEKLQAHKNEIGDKYSAFLKYLLLAQRHDFKFNMQRETIDYELLNVCYSLKCQEELDDLLDFSPEPIRASEIFVRHNEFRRAAELLFDAHHYNEALPYYICVSVTHDASHLRPLLFKIRRLPQTEEMIPFLSLLAPFLPSEVTQILLASNYSLSDCQFILRGLSSWEDYLDKQPMHDNIVIEMVVYLISCIQDGDDCKRNKLRQILLNMDYPMLQTIKIFLESPELKVERLFADARGNPSTTLHELIIVHKDFEAAELLSARFAKSHPEVALRLLKAYLDDKDYATASTRIGRLLAHVGVDFKAEELLQKLPENMSIQELSKFLKSSVTNKIEMNYIQEITLAANERLLQSQQLDKKDNNPCVELTDHSVCPVCQQPLTYSDQLIILPTRFIVHNRCYRNPNLCPVTNALF